VARLKRKLDGEQITPTTLKMRASVHEKIESFIPPGGSFVQTVEEMAEFLYKRRERKRDKQHNLEEKSS